MRHNNSGFLRGSLFALLLLASDSSAPFVFAASPERLDPLYNFITIDLPTPDGEFGFASLADINDKAEIAGGFTNSNLGPYGFILDKKIRPTEIDALKMLFLLHRNRSISMARSPGLLWLSSSA
jgi:hypothetical protein